MNSIMYYFKIIKTGDIWLIINAAEISKLIFKILSKKYAEKLYDSYKKFLCYAMLILCALVNQIFKKPLEW